MQTDNQPNINSVIEKAQKEYQVYQELKEINSTLKQDANQDKVIITNQNPIGFVLNQ